MTHRISALSSRDGGFTLVEVLIVIVILGILATVTVFAVRGTTESAAEKACNTERRILDTAAETYIAHEGVDVLPASGADDDRYERGLVDAGFIKSVSPNWDLTAAGVLVKDVNAAC